MEFKKKRAVKSEEIKNKNSHCIRKYDKYGMLSSIEDFGFHYSLTTFNYSNNSDLESIIQEVFHPEYKNVFTKQYSYAENFIGIFEYYQVLRKIDKQSISQSFKRGYENTTEKELVNTFEEHYNNGLLISKKRNSNTNQSFSEELFEYDSSGNKIKHVFKEQGVVIEELRYEYNNDRLISEENFIYVDKYLKRNFGKIYVYENDLLKEVLYTNRVSFATTYIVKSESYEYYPLDEDEIPIKLKQIFTEGLENHEKDAYEFELANKYSDVQININVPLSKTSLTNYIENTNEVKISEFYNYEPIETIKKEKYIGNNIFGAHTLEIIHREYLRDEYTREELYECPIYEVRVEYDLVKEKSSFVSSRKVCYYED